MERFAAASRRIPELTARLVPAIADESARLLLTSPDQYPVERLMAHADWLLRQLEPGSADATTSARRIAKDR